MGVPEGTGGAVAVEWRGGCGEKEERQAVIWCAAFLRRECAPSLRVAAGAPPAGGGGGGGAQVRLPRIPFSLPSRCLELAERAGGRQRNEKENVSSDAFLNFLEIP